MYRVTEGSPNMLCYTGNWLKTTKSPTFSLQYIPVMLLLVTVYLNNDVVPLIDKFTAQDASVHS